MLVYEAACEGIVLPENDGTLPLTPGRIALFGLAQTWNTKICRRVGEAIAVEMNGPRCGLT